MYNTKDYELENEVWKDIPKYEGIYQASSFGRIRSINNKVTYSIRHGARCWKGRIISPKSMNDYKTGYRVTLWKNKDPKDWLIGRLVCMTFNGESDLTVNHIDGNRLNNNIYNLEWIPLKENIVHAFNTGLMPMAERVRLFNNESELIFRSLRKAGEHIGRNKGYISGCLAKATFAKALNGEVYEIEILKRVNINDKI